MPIRGALPVYGASVRCFPLRGLLVGTCAVAALAACGTGERDTAPDVVADCIDAASQEFDIDATAERLTGELFPTAPDGSALTDEEFAELLNVVKADEDQLRLLLYRNCMNGQGWWCISGVDDPLTGAVWEAESQAAAERGWADPQPWQCRSEAGEVVDAPSLD